MKYIKCISLILIFFLLAIGCAGDYGRIKRQSPTDNKMTLAELKENWEDYHIYYGNNGGRYPINILFDPKNDETRIVGDGWHQIEDQQDLSEKISETQVHWDNHEVYIIEGPDRQFFGYIYCSWGGGRPVRFTPSIYDVRVVDQHTVHVFQGV